MKRLVDKLKKTIVSVSIVIAIVIIPVFAQADDGYICRVTQYNDTAYGPYGGVVIHFYTDPNCNGGLRRIGYVCSGGKSGFCSNNRIFEYSEAQLQSIFIAATGAARNGDRVNYWFSDRCENNYHTCLQGIYFRGD